MTYDYRCGSCLFIFDAIKAVSEMDYLESCPKCHASAARIFIPRSILFSGTKIESPEFNPGLGCIIKNTAHRKEVARQKGLIEIGNETPEVIHKHYDKRRSEKLEAVWNEVDKGWVGNGE